MIGIWDVESGRQLAAVRAHEGPIYSVAFSPDGTRIASGSADMTIKLWGASSGEEMANLRIW